MGRRYKAVPVMETGVSSTSRLLRFKALSKDKWPRMKLFLKKYFCEGQKTLENTSSEEESTSWDFVNKNRRLLGFLLPPIFWHLVWWPLAVRYDFFDLYPTNWPIVLTMVFGALVGGATSEGGGAIAFPVLTMAFSISPLVARDFSLMIQASGMSAAAFTIVWMKIRLEYWSLLFSTFGAIFGVVFGLEVLDDLISPPQKKMGFVSFFFSFAVALFLLNRRKKRPVVDAIPNFTWWKALVLIFCGFIGTGGTMTGLLGSGVDIISFSVLTLLFSVSEKVATPTSVVLMAINTAVGFYWRHLIQVEISEEAWSYLSVCVPVVVVCAPLGSLVASHFHRQVLALLIYVLETVALISAFVIIKPGLYLSLASVGIILVSSAAFIALSFIGIKILPKPASSLLSESSIQSA